MKRIAIDLDDTLVPLVDILVKEMLKDRSFPAFKGYHTIKDFSFDEEMSLYTYIRQKINNLDIIKFKPTSGSKTAVTKLFRDYELYIITARNKDVKNHTRKWVEHHFSGAFKKIIFTRYISNNYVKTKGQLCKDYNISLLIDDQKKYVLDAYKYGVKAIVFDYKNEYAWSKGEYPKEIPIANNWKEVLQIIKKIKW